MSDTTIKIEGFAEQDLPHDLARLAEYLAEGGEDEASDLIKTAIAAFERGRIAGLKEAMDICNGPAVDPRDIYRACAARIAEAT